MRVNGVPCKIEGSELATKDSGLAEKISGADKDSAGRSGLAEKISGADKDSGGGGAS